MTQFNAQQAFSQLAAPQFRNPSFLEKIQTLLPQFLARVADSNFEQGGSPLRISDLIEKLGPPGAQQQFQNEIATSSIDQQLIQGQLESLVRQGRESREVLAAPGQRAATERSQRGILGRDPKPGEAFLDFQKELQDRPQIGKLYLGRTKPEKELFTRVAFDLQETSISDNDFTIRVIDADLGERIRKREEGLEEDDPKRIMSKSGNIKEGKEETYFKELRAALPSGLLEELTEEDVISFITKSILPATSEGNTLETLVRDFYQLPQPVQKSPFATDFSSLGKSIKPIPEFLGGKDLSLRKIIDSFLGPGKPVSNEELIGLGETLMLGPLNNQPQLNLPNLQNPLQSNPALSQQQQIQALLERITTRGN